MKSQIYYRIRRVKRRSAGSFMIACAFFFLVRNKDLRFFNVSTERLQQIAGSVSLWIVEKASRTNAICGHTNKNRQTLMGWKGKKLIWKMKNEREWAERKKTQTNFHHKLQCLTPKERKWRRETENELDWEKRSEKRQASSESCIIS